MRAALIMAFPELLLVAVGLVCVSTSGMRF